MTEERYLVERASHGDVIALEELLQEHLPSLRAFVRLRSGPTIRAKESVSDLVQSTCREVLQGLERFQWEGAASFRAWLYTTAQRKIAHRAEHWNAAKRAIGLEVALDPRGATGADEDARVLDVYRALGGSPSAEVVGIETFERLERAFEALSPEEREVITLSRIVGLSHREISLELGCTEGAARVRLFRALAHLSERLAEPELPPA